MIEGLSHITLIVKDLEKTARLFQDVLGAREVYSSGGKEFSLSPEKFFLIGGVWIAIMQGDPLPSRSYNHLAFKIPESEIETFKAKLLSAGVELLPPRPRVQGEGQSLYFYDFDNHLFELHTSDLASRVKEYNKRADGKKKQN